MQSGMFLNLLVSVPRLLSYLAGVIVALILVNRRRSTAAYLALTGFAILLVSALVASIASVAPFWLMESGVSAARIGLIIGLGSILVNLAGTVGVICLIVALWHGLRAG